MNWILPFLTILSCFGIYFGQKYILHQDESRKLSSFMFSLYLIMFVLSCIIIIFTIIITIVKFMNSLDSGKNVDITNIGNSNGNSNIDKLYSKNILKQQYMTQYALKYIN